MASIKTFEELNCWKMGRELRQEVSRMINTFPDYEKYDLISQMRRASRSVTHNIAEGYGRFHHKENIQFCRIARGSLHELIDQFITASDEGYISNDEFEKMKCQTNNCITVLNGYIRYLKNIK